MKKVLFTILLGSFLFQSCNNNGTTDDTDVEIDLVTQNTYDNQAAQKFLNDNYFDAQGNAVPFSDTDATDDNYPKLSSYNPITLPSGVVYVSRLTAQPNPGKVIGSSDVIKLMYKATFTKAILTDNVVSFGPLNIFNNTMSNTGVPQNDPIFFYVTPTYLTQTGKTENYYVIEGFKEGLQYFKSCEIDDADNYNLQGLIIVPSRVAYGRDSNLFDTSTVKFNDRSFIFNFQVYKTTPRT